MKNFTLLLTTILAAVLPVVAVAGISNLDALKLLPVTGDTYSLEIEDTSGVDVLTLTAAGILSLPAVACQFNIGSASSTTGSKVSVFDGGADNKPGAIALYADNGTAVLWLFVSSAGALRTHTAYPADDDTDGTLVGTTDLAVDFDLTATGGSTSDGDFTVAGYAEFAGTTELSGASTILGDAAGDVITINSDDIQFTAAAKVTFPATAYAVQWRVGTGSSTGHSADAADCLFVEGITEIDGAFYADAAATVAGQLSPTGIVAYGDKAELTLDGAGAITATGVYHTIDTLADAASGDLVTIAAGAAGQVLVIQCEHTDRSIVVKSTGNILPVGGDVTMDETTCSLTLIYSAALSKWVITASYGN